MAPGSPMADHRAPGSARRIAGRSLRCGIEPRHCILPSQAVFHRPQTTGLPCRGHLKVGYYRRDEILFMERQRHSRRGQERHLSKVLPKHKPDILCLQETKAERGQAEIDLPDYREYWNSAEKKGYSGTAIFAKQRTASRSSTVFPKASRRSSSFADELQARRPERGPRHHGGVRQVLRRHRLHAQCQGRSVSACSCATSTGTRRSLPTANSSRRRSP